MKCALGSHAGIRPSRFSEHLPLATRSCRGHKAAGAGAQRMSVDMGFVRPGLGQVHTTWALYFKKEMALCTNLTFNLSLTLVRLILRQRGGH